MILISSFFSDLRGDLQIFIDIGRSVAVQRGNTDRAGSLRAY